MNIGFIGLGLMGRPMAINVARGGHTLHLWARRAASLAPFAELGAQAHASPAEVAKHADLVVTMVADAPDVEQVTLGENGVAAGAKKGLLVVDMSTIAPAAAQRIGKKLAEKGLEFLDAPVSGGEVGAINATLSIMVGGKAAAFEKMKPVFELMGKNIVHVGDSGAGQVAKACNQMVMVAAIEACAEAARLAEAAGVDFALVRQAMLGGSAGSRVLDAFGGRMAARDFTPGVEARLHHKDYALLMDEASRIGAPLPVSAAVWQQLNALMANGWGSRDTSALLSVLEAAARQ